METNQTQIKFTPGKMERFISTKSFTLGGINHSVYDGMEILFDGTNVELNGSRFMLPTLRGAIREGWLVPADEYDPDAAPTANPSANIGVRAANDLGQNPLSPPKKAAITTVESDERVVMSRSERTQNANQRTSEVRQSQGRAGAFVARGNSTDLVGGAEFGVEVPRSFRTQAKTALQITQNTVGTAIRDAELVKIQPGEGISEDELLSKMTLEERETYIAGKESRKGDIQSRAPGYVPPPAVTTNLASMNQNDSRSQPTPQPKARMMTASAPSVVGRVAPTQSRVQEGISIGLTSGGGIDTYDASGSTEKPRESVVEQEGMTFRNTNGPKTGFGQPVRSEAQFTSSLPVDMSEAESRIETDGTADYRRMVAKSLCKEFPDDYSFSDHWKRRLAMIRLNYENSPDIIRAIFAAESDEFKKLLIKEFPEAFPS
jgi:hypothetical protein